MFEVRFRPGIDARRVVNVVRRTAVVTLGAIALLWGVPAFACPASNALKNFDADPLVGASFTLDATGTIATYLLDTTDENSVGGVPGLIEYCIYPIQPPGNPDSASATYDQFGQWAVDWGSMQGFFAFTRPNGNPTNIPFDGTTNIEVGTATWAAGAPLQQTILLHVNDPELCNSLYTGSPGTCFVFPGLMHGGPNPQACTGAPACKDVIIDEAITTQPLTVPGGDLLHIHYTYTIVNQPTNTFDMVFYPPSTSTQDVNTGGGKDYFGCEQTADPHGNPGQWTTPVSEPDGFVLTPVSKSGNCSQSYFFLTDGSPVKNPVLSPIVLTPGQSVVFGVDMITGLNPAHKQEFTSCGQHLLNSGFTVKWFQIPDGSSVPNIKNAGKLYSYSTNINPIYVNVVSSSDWPGNVTGKLVCAN